MAHFAQLDENNKVIRVIVIDDNELIDNGQENEEKGKQFCKSLFGDNTNWIQTSYNTRKNQHKKSGQPKRKNYAGIGYTYDLGRDAFIPPKKRPNQILNEDTCDWEEGTK